MPPKCPTCGATVPPANETFPFCSSRCRLVDLGRWLDEEYRIPVVDDEDEDGQPSRGERAVEPPPPMTAPPPGRKPGPN